MQVLYSFLYIAKQLNIDDIFKITKLKESNNIVFSYDPAVEYSTLTLSPAICFLNKQKSPLVVFKPTDELELAHVQSPAFIKNKKKSQPLKNCEKTGTY